MDVERFDNLLRSLSQTPSRRGVGRLLGGVVLGGPLALLGLAEADAKRKKKRKKRGRGKTPPPSPPPCVAEDPAATCSRVVCGTTRNNCGQLVACGCTDPATPDCCENACFAACGAGEFRNRVSCQCVPCRPEGTTSGDCERDEECCSNVCGGFPSAPSSPGFCRFADCRPLGGNCGGDARRCCEGSCGILDGSGNVNNAVCF